MPIMCSMIALVDCNNFYASCERLFRPELNGKPVVVLSNNDGCVIARSNEAKAIGIKMGAPAFMMEEMLTKNEVTVFSSNYTLYGSLSNRVMNVLREHVQNVEVYSIDEAFLDLSGLHNVDLFDLGLMLREKITNDVGIPVSIGIAPTKTLAKMANRFAKKERKQFGVYVADSDWKIQQILQYTDIEDVWGIGRQHTIRLKEIGVSKASDFINLNEQWVRKNMTVVGQRMLNELRGISSIEWEMMPPPKKGICTAKSFGKLLSEKEPIAGALSDYAANCTKKLRQQKCCAGIVHVFIQTNNHRTQDKQYFRSITLNLEMPSNYTPDIIKAALKGLDIIYRPGYNFKKVGVMLFDIVPESQIQLGIFQNKPNELSWQLMKTLDNINIKFGKDILKYAAQGYKKIWRIRQQKLSPCYTTDINQILKIDK